MPQWLLVGKFGASGETRSKLIAPVPFRIGRRPEASLTLPRSTVSGLHAELFTRSDRLFVRDLGSTNGTFINGRRISEISELLQDDVIQFADIALKIACEMEADNCRTLSEDFHEHALARMQFEDLLIGRQVQAHFQPILDMTTGRIVAFEALARSRTPGLETPGKMFEAASDLQSEAELSDLMRLKGVEGSRQFPQQPPIYLNTHPVEFEGSNSWDWVVQLRKMAGTQPLTIEVHEAAVTDVHDVARFRSVLRDHQIGLAFDDFGAGQARIAELAEVRPDCLKFDRRIIMGLDSANPSRQRFVRCLVDAIRDIGVVPLAEGVETEGEYQICLELGFQLVQGYFTGRPGPVEQYLDWDRRVFQVGPRAHPVTNLSTADSILLPDWSAAEPPRTR